VEPDPTMRYFFAVRAYNMSGLQSDFSEEVSTDDPMTLPVTGVTPSLPIDEPLTTETADVPAPPLTAAKLHADKPTPQPAGSQIVFTATPSGGRFHKYKWWVFNGVAWTIAKEWSSANTFIWTPTTANAHYQVLVRVRHGSGRSRASVGSAMAYPIDAINLPDDVLP
jgi:hypothetical protein